MNTAIMAANNVALITQLAIVAVHHCNVIHAQHLVFDLYLVQSL